MKLPTLDEYKPSTRFVKELKPLFISDSLRATVLTAAKFVVGVSSSLGMYNNSVPLYLGEPQIMSVFLY
jgi:hypothetical protein